MTHSKAGTGTGSTAQPQRTAHRAQSTEHRAQSTEHRAQSIVPMSSQSTLLRSTCHFSTTRQLLQPRRKDSPTTAVRYPSLLAKARRERRPASGFWPIMARSRSRSTATTPAKSRRGKSGSSNMRSRVESTKDNNKDTLGGADKKLGPKLFDAPGMVLDMCFGVQVGLEVGRV
jgi:hypothetical protein